MFYVGFRIKPNFLSLITGSICIMFCFYREILIKHKQKGLREGRSYGNKTSASTIIHILTTMYTFFIQLFA